MAKAKKVTKSAGKKPVKAKVKPKTKVKIAKAVKKPNDIGLKVGDLVPSLTLPATGQQSVSLADLGKRAVLYFYPRDMTPGCTIEGHEFTKLKNQFEQNNTVVLGVSRDSLQSHEKFKQKENYKVDLIADEKSQLCDAFGVIKDKNMYGKKVRGIERSTFVIDETGRVVKEWRKVKVEGHAAEVLDYIKNNM
jgi:thioredoxin-dependent peroxiredoxin